MNALSVYNIEFVEKVREVGNKLINDYISNGFAQPGVNGPYDDSETEVRNLSHLLIIVAVEYLSFHIEAYGEVVENIGARLLSMKSPEGTYRMRNKAGKDECNGVIGHAWLVEALLFAYRVTKDKKYIDESVRICKMHKFQYHIGLWGRPLQGNDNNAIDYTLNHQLWYAATLSELQQVFFEPEFNKEIKSFLKRIHTLVHIHQDGRISHCIYKRLGLVQSIKIKAKCCIDTLNGLMNRPSLKYKEVGYHMFNLMAFARLKLSTSSSFFSSQKFKKIVAFCNNEKYIKELESPNIELDSSTFSPCLNQDETLINIYGYPYNVVGFESAFIQEVFPEYADNDFFRKLVVRQFELTWDNKRKEFTRHCHDKNTINYRIYEAYRLIYMIEDEKAY